VNELLARVRAALRRISVGQQPASEVIELGSFRIDPELHSVQVGGREVHLTPKELWGENSVEQPEYLRVFVGHLRKKLEPQEGPPRYILTEPWVGYRFDPGE
jgi:two-component system KDP operon response regulator KdpE